MDGADNRAAAHNGRKRQRERELADKRQEKRVEDVLAHAAHLIDAIAGINTNYVCTLNEEQLRLSHQLETLQTLHTSAQLKVSEMTTDAVQSNLKALRGAVGGTVKDRLIEALRAQVDQGQSEVFDALAAHIDDALQGSLAVADKQLSAERQLSATLVEQLRGYAHKLLDSTKAANQRTFRAEVEAMQKDIVIAKLRATQLFEQNRLIRHEHEVDALMRVVAQLAERSRFAESTRGELQKAKQHVRWLEQYLDLNGIVAAVQPENTTAARSTDPSLTSSAPPDPSLRHSAPNYFALKMLEHKDVTLTELVDSWQSQEARICEAERRYTQLESVVRQVQHDALMVHQRYLEEKQRREIADRRITDMMRERLYPQTDSNVFQEVQRLRWAYTEVVDDAAQLAVNLKVCREELRDAQGEVAQLRAQLRQLQRDAETDQVAQTIRELRSEYEERVRGLEAVWTRTQLQLTLAQQVCRQYGSVVDEATSALQEAAQTNVELSEMPLALTRHRDDVKSDNAWQQGVQTVVAQAEKLVSLTSEIKNFGLVHGELYETQMEKLMNQWSRTRSEAAEATTAAATLAEGAVKAGRHLDTTPSRSTVDVSSGSHTLVSSTYLPDESLTKVDSVVHSSKLALREALMLLVTSLQSADVERTNLLDASLSDAQYVTELVREVGAITNERDRLRAQVKTCRDLLEKNHVTVVERALMHDMPVEDSLNVAEAAERITVLRDQLSAAKQLCDRALSEVKQVTAEKGAAEAQLMELTKAHEVLQGHAARLADKLKASLEKEGSLMAEVVTLQNEIAHLMQQPPASATATCASADNNYVPDAEDYGGAFTQAAQSQLSALFTTLTETLQRLDGEVRTLHASRDAIVSATVADGANTSRESDGTPKTNEGSSDAALLASLSRSGMMSVVTALRETLHKVGLLKASLQDAAGAQAAALCAAAAADAAPVSMVKESAVSCVIPPPSQETQQRSHAYMLAQREATLAQFAAERQQMQDRLQRAERTAVEMEAANQRLLAISKSVLEKQSTLKAENERLREQVQQLKTPPMPAPAPAPTVLSQSTSASVSSDPAHTPQPDEAEVDAAPETVSGAMEPPSSSVEGSVGEQAVSCANAETAKQLLFTESVASMPGVALRVVEPAANVRANEEEEKVQGDEPSLVPENEETRNGDTAGQGPEEERHCHLREEAEESPTS